MTRHGKPCRARAAFLLLACAALLQPAHAADCPAQPQILARLQFSGNRVTRPEVMLREMLSREGAPTDARTLLEDAQRLRDLGLFRQVDVLCSRTEAGLVAEFALREKYYLLVAPRSDANSDGDYSYGLHLSWHNALGRNHTWRATILEHSSSQTGRGRSLEYRISQHAPYLLGSPFDLDWRLAHERADWQPGDGTGVGELVDDQFRIGLDRHLGRGPASQGWRVGGAYEYRKRSLSDAGRELGVGHGLFASLKYRDRRDSLYSETGLVGELELGHAGTALGSDYDWSQLTATLDYERPLGETAHQTLGLHLETEMQRGGPDDGLNQYSLGGASLLRGYPRNTAEGDAYAMLRIEAYRPLHWRWLRWGGFIEAGAAWGGAQAHTPGLLASAGLGLQIRPTWFVGLVIDLGIGVPLIARDAGDSGPAFYGSGR